MEVEDRTPEGVTAKWLGQALGYGALLGSLLLLSRRNQREEWRRAESAAKAQALHRVTRMWTMRVDDPAVRREISNLYRMQHR